MFALSGDSETKQNSTSRNLHETKRTHLDRCTNEKVLLSLLSVQGSVGSHTKENRPTLREILSLLRRRPDMS